MIDITIEKHIREPSRIANLDLFICEDKIKEDKENYIGESRHPLSVSFDVLFGVC